MYNIDNKKIDDAVSKVIAVIENNSILTMKGLFSEFNTRLYFTDLKEIIMGFKESVERYKEWPDDLKLTTLVQITTTKHLAFIDHDTMDRDDAPSSVYHALGHVILHNSKPLSIYDVDKKDIGQFLYVAEYEKQDLEANIFAEKIIMYLDSLNKKDTKFH